jgi:hypothetical protein
MAEEKENQEIGEEKKEKSGSKLLLIYCIIADIIDYRWIGCIFFTYKHI